MKVYVDRFEEDFVVLINAEGRGGYDIRKEKFGFELHEGDMLDVVLSEDGELISARFLEEETRARREKYTAMMERLRKKK